MLKAFISYLYNYHHFKPVQVFPFPVNPSLQVQMCCPGPVSVHVALPWQSSLSVPQFLIATKHTENWIITELTITKTNHPSQV